VAAAGTRDVPDLVTLEVRLPFAAVDGVLRRAKDDPAVHEAAPGYDADGAAVRLTLRADARSRWEAILSNLARGAVTIRPVVGQDAPDAT
jgi:hypothetical protein